MHELQLRIKREEAAAARKKPPPKRACKRSKRMLIDGLGESATPRHQLEPPRLQLFTPQMGLCHPVRKVQVNVSVPFAMRTIVMVAKTG